MALCCLLISAPGRKGMVEAIVLSLWLLCLLGPSSTPASIPSVQARSLPVTVLVCSDTAAHVLFGLFLHLGTWLCCVTSTTALAVVVCRGNEVVAGGKGGRGHALPAAWLWSDSRQQCGVQQQRKMSDKGCATCCCATLDKSQGSTAPSEAFQDGNLLLPLSPLWELPPRCISRTRLLGRVSHVPCTSALGETLGHRLCLSSLMRCHQHLRKLWVKARILNGRNTCRHGCVKIVKQQGITPVSWPAWPLPCKDLSREESVRKATTWPWHLWTGEEKWDKGWGERADGFQSTCVCNTIAASSALTCCVWGRKDSAAEAPCRGRRGCA